MALPYTTEREEYGRHIKYSAQQAQCDFCGEQERCMAIDTSDGEYCTAYVCARCCASSLAIVDTGG